MNRKNKTGIIGIIITVVVLILVVILSNIKMDKLSFMENVFSSIVMPVQNGFTHLKNRLKGDKQFFSDIETLENENKELKDKNGELEKQLRELEILKSENNTLKEYVNLKEKYSEYVTIPGYVIQRDLGNYSKVVVINLGKKDGIDVNMPVISEKGLVGHIISVTESTAKVQTIIDTSSVVSTNIMTSRDPILLRGSLEDSSVLKATYIPTDATILQEDGVETSGLGGIYPKGIYIGSIKQVINTKNITDRYAIIEPAVDFDKLETVLVITQK